MNKLDRIKNLENELAELKAEIVEEEKVKDWNPSGGDITINLGGDIIHGTSLELAKDYGVEFDNEKQAKQAAIAYRRYHRLYRLALELNDGADYQPNWNNPNELKYYIRSDIRLGMMFTGYCEVNSQPCGIYFKTEKLAQKAIEILGDELL